tara:strand:+ start:2510 stop:5485 length:2976 start_codon:yes stop_codon:yes gene_type:complete
MGGSVGDIVRIATTIAVAYYAPAFGAQFGAVGSLANVSARVALTIGAGAIANALAPPTRARNSSLQQQSYSSQTANRSLMIRQPISSRETVYGSTKKSGAILFMETTDNNKQLHMIVQVASHEIQSFDKIYFNDEELTLARQTDLFGNIVNDANGIFRFYITAPSKYAQNTRTIVNNSPFGIGFSYGNKIKLHTGSDDQLADADLVGLVSKWTSAHRLRGIAYIYLQLEYDVDAFPQGVPNLSAEIKGKKLFDFRDNSTAFSSNPALCIFDYLTDTRLGLGISRDNIDTASFTTMANLCDENVTKVGGGTEKKYTCNGIVYSDIAPMQILQDMLTSCLGVLSYSNGKFILKGGQYVAPVASFDEDDFISGININSKQSRKSLHNTVKGIFTGEETNFQPTDYPAVTSSTFVSQDGETITQDVDLPFTSSSATAQRIAKVSLFKNRQQMVLTTTLNMKAFKLQVGDTVSISNARFGFTNKQFEVAEWVMNTEVLGIDVILKETTSAVYDWDAEESEFVLDNTTLPTAEDVSPPSLVVTDELRVYAETPITVMKVVCSSSQGTTNEFEVEAQNTNEAGSEFITLGRSKGNIFELVNAQDGAIYNVRARSINAFNVHSSFTTTVHEVVGKTAPPADVTNFSSNVVGDIVHLNWTPVTDLDLSHYIVRHTPLTSSQKFEEGLIVAKKIGKPANTITLPAQTGTYMIKAIDVLGIESENSAKTAIIKNAISRDFNVVATSTQSTGFAGTKTETEVVARDSVNYLQIKLGELFDSGLGDFDDQSGNFDDGGTTAYNTDGHYDFPTIDLGAIYNSRVTFTCKYNRFDATSLFDSFLGNFDDRGGLLDGAYSEFNDVNVELLISTSDDNSTYTDYRSYILGDYKARYIKLRVNLTSSNQTATPAIFVLSATVDMPDRTIAEDDITSGTSAKVVTFSPAFKELQGLGIEVDNLDQNQHYVISSKSATGFTINFYQGTGTGSAVTKDFSYVAKGYGYVESA